MKTCSNFFNAHVQNTPSIRHFDAILTPSRVVPTTLLTFKRHLPVTKSDVLLTFCTYNILYTKKLAVKLPGELATMATMRCARRHGRGQSLQMCRQRVGLQVNLFCVLGTSPVLIVELGTYVSRVVDLSRALKIFLQVLRFSSFRKINAYI